MTLHELRALWSTRDYRYTLRRAAVPPEQAAQVRLNRQAEAELLPRPVRAAAFLEAGRWEPPERIRRIVP
jgi:hypothetical protein